jgi:carbon monoxide dehydrogenase subunit G
MWITEFSAECKASEAKIWQILTDVENWKEWIGGIEYSTINGSFQNGTSITIKNIKAPKATNILKDVVLNKAFNYHTRFFQNVA